MSYRTALLVGWLWVNIPVIVLIFTPSIVLVFLSGGTTEVSPVHFGVVAMLSFTAAWLWWSIMLPRWRLWSYNRVDNPLVLKHMAVNAQLTWPDGSIWSRTEMKPRQHGQMERRLEREALEAFGPYRPPEKEEETREQKASAFFMVFLPVVTVFIAAAFHDRASGAGLSSRTNAGLVLLGTILVVGPIVKGRLGISFSGWHRILPIFSVLLGILAFAAIEYSSVATALRVALLPLLPALLIPAVVAFLVRR